MSSEIIRYTIGGVSSSVAEYLSYLFSLAVLKYSPYISLVIGFIVSIIVSFLFNEFFVYKKEAGEKRSKLKALGKNFMTYFGTGIVLKEILLFMFVRLMHMKPELAPILILIIIAPLNYFITKYWAFKTK